MIVDRRDLLKAVAVGATAGLSAIAPAIARSATTELLPRRLAAGMTVGLIAPASNTSENEDIRFASDIIRSLGFLVKEGRHLYDRNQYLAGTDEERVADLNSMFADSTVDAIFCLRGGYGAARILPLLDYNAIAANPKVLLGYSDVTALLNAIHERTGLITFHGPIAAQTFSDYTYTEFTKVMVDGQTPARLGAAPAFESGPGRVERDNRLTRFVGGRARGRLVGGNLTLITSVLGTPYQPNFEDAILFLEDVGEAPYRIDRMLTQLWLSGVLDQVAGIAFGKFTDADAEGNTFSVEEIIRQRCGKLSVPVLRGLMIGHVDDQTVVPVGGTAELDADAGTLTLLEPAVR